MLGLLIEWLDQLKQSVCSQTSAADMAGLENVPSSSC